MNYEIKTHHNSLDELIDHLETVKPMAGLKRQSSMITKSAYSTFYTFTNYNECLWNAKHGWSEGLSKLTAQASYIPRITSGSEFVIERHAYRGRPNIDRVLRAHPKPFNVKKRVPTQTTRSGRIIRLYVHRGALGNVTDRELFDSGASIYSLIQALETQGYTTELTTVHAVSIVGMGAVTTVRVKSAGDYISPERLAFALCSADMHRRLIFGCRERFEDATFQRKFDGTSYGSTTDYVDDAWLQSPNSLVIHAIPSDPVKFIHEQLDKLGVKYDV